MAHKKGGGSSRNGRDSQSQRLGVKVFSGQFVHSGSILVRQRGKVPEVLLGCRDAKHAFMPNRYVFPGGRVDPQVADLHVLERHVGFAAVRIDALHDGRRVPLLHLQAARPGWDRRYWLDEPVELPAGAIIEAMQRQARPVPVAQERMRVGYNSG